MRQADLTRYQSWSILGGAAVMLSLAMGMRQSLGLFQPHMIREIGISAADFSLAVAIQNVAWGVTQPFVGMMADRYGARPIAVIGVLIYALGLVISIAATSALALTLGAGVCIGIALSCTASNIAMAVTSRTATPLKRSVAMGAVSAIGSIGLTIASPLAQTLISSNGWQVAMVAFLGLAVVMLPAAFLAGGADRIEYEHPPGAARQSTGDAIREAFAHRGFLVMTASYFVCGLQLVFLTTHLPTYLEICGMDPSVGGSALALIGLFNVIGSYLFGWLGGRYSKRLLLGGLYVLRSLAIAAYFATPPTTATTLVFAAVMGTLWLGIVPLFSGLVVQLFGVRYMATIAGLAFLCHQAGSFLGAWGGGLIYAGLGSYDRAWQSAAAIGLVMGIVQMFMDDRPTPRIAAERAAQPAMA